jgi:ABC-2 type transport system permease protein
VVAELLRLKGRLLRNGFRRAPSRVLGSGLLLALAVAGLALLFIAASRVSALQGELVGRVVVIVGAEVVLGALLLPAMFSRTPLLAPRAFLGYPLRSPALAGALLVLTLVGPALLFVALVLVPLVVWRGEPAALAEARWAAPLLLMQLLLVLRVGVALGEVASTRPVLRGWVRLLGVVLLLGGLVTVAALLLPRIVLLAPERSLSPLAPLARFFDTLQLGPFADLLATSPLASLWGAPARLAVGAGVSATTGAGDAARAELVIGAITVVLLALLWWAIVAVALRPTRRLRLARADRVPTWFRRLPANPAGAVAARSFIYWVRDPRYRVVFGILPLLPIATALSFFVGGVPVSIGALVPLPLMVLLLSWSTLHNDIAYDSTAIWSHVAAQTRGVHDRLGRIWPVIAFGAVLIALGTPLTVWVQGDPDALPVTLGITIALLLGGVGVGSAVSSRYPYPAPRPGDGAFTYPQASGGTGGGVQAASFFLTILVAAPAIAAAVLWQLGAPGPYPWIALVAGVAGGAIAVLLGIRGGAVAFDQRGPELLAFTLQN